MTPTVHKFLELFNQSIHDKVVINTMLFLVTNNCVKIISAKLVEYNVKQISDIGLVGLDKE